MPHSIVQLTNGDGDMLFPRSIDVNNVYHNSVALGTYLSTFKANLISSFYPVGSIIILGSNTNPNTIMPGTTWQAYAGGEILVGYGYLDGNSSKQQITFSKEVTGQATVTITAATMPSHTHTVGKISAANGSKGYDYRSSGSYVGTQSAGGSAAHNNMMPYIAVNIWRRTA